MGLGDTNCWHGYLYFNFACQNERIETLNGRGSRRRCLLDPPLIVAFTCTLALALNSMIQVNARTSLAMWSLGRARCGNVLITAPIEFNSICSSLIKPICLKLRKVQHSLVLFCFFSSRKSYNFISRSPFHKKICLYLAKVTFSEIYFTSFSESVIFRNTAKRFYHRDQTSAIRLRSRSSDWLYGHWYDSYFLRKYP